MGVKLQLQNFCRNKWALVLRSGIEVIGVQSLFGSNSVSDNTHLK